MQIRDKRDGTVRLFYIPDSDINLPVGDSDYEIKYYGSDLPVSDEEIDRYKRYGIALIPCGSHLLRSVRLSRQRQAILT